MCLFAETEAYIVYSRISRSKALHRRIRHVHYSTICEIIIIYQSIQCGILFQLGKQFKAIKACKSTSIEGTTAKYNPLLNGWIEKKSSEIVELGLKTFIPVLENFMQQREEISQQSTMK